MAAIAGRLHHRADGAQIDHAVAHHAAVEQEIGGRNQPVVDVVGEDAAAGARDLVARGRGPTRRDRRRPRRRRRRPARRRGRSPARACSRRRGRRRTSDAAARSRAARPPAGHRAAARPVASRTCRRAPAMSREPFGSPPTTRIRHCAPIAAASSTARRLSSSAARRPAASAAGNMPPRQRPVTVMSCARMSLPARSTPQACTMSRQGEIAEMPGARAALDQLLERPRLHGHRVDREQRAVVRKVAHQAATPRVAITRRMRAAALSGSRSRPAASARRNSSARCSVERALSWPPTSVK